MAAAGRKGRILAGGPPFQPFELGTRSDRHAAPFGIRVRNGGAPLGELLDLAEAMRDLADRATTAEGQPALDDLVHLAVERVPPARWASLTVLQGKRFRTEASTDDRAARADVLQYDMGFGPCVDAVLVDSVYVSGDVARDQRWPSGASA